MTAPRHPRIHHASHPALALALALALPAVARAQPATTPPRLRHFVGAPYPPEALRRGTAASVVLELTLDDAGRVAAARVLEPASPAFDEAALAAARDFVFDPARVGGRPVAARLRYRYRFAPPAQSPTDEDAPRPAVAAPAASLPRPAAAAAPEQEATVRSRAASREVFRRELVAEDLRRMPGTRGDALLAVLNLPGLARPQFGLGQFAVRGSDPQDTLVTLESQPLGLAFHFEGLASAIATELVERVEFLPGNFSARYGRAAGGVVNVTLRAPARDRVHLAADVDVIDAGAYASVPLGRHAAVAVGVRRSYLDGFASLLLPAGSLGFTRFPRYWDYQVVLDADLTPRDAVRVVATGSDDALVENLGAYAAYDPSLRGDAPLHLGFHGVQARWRHRFSPAVTHTFAPAASVTATGLDTAAGIRSDSTNYNVSVRDELEVRAGPSVRVFAGFDVQAGRLDALVVAPAVSNNGITDPVQPGQLRTFAGVRDYLNPAGYLEAEVSATPAVRVLAGVRADWFSQSGVATVDPRGTVRVALDPRLALRAGVGRYSTPVRGYLTLPDFGNPDLRPEDWLHLTAGFQMEVIPGVLEFTADAFAKSGAGTAAPSARTVVRDGAAAPERFANTGSARVLGGEWLLRLRPGRVPFFAWVSYTYQRAERRDGADLPWYPSPWDMPHVLTLVAGALLPHGWEVGARLRYTSGIVDPRVTGGLYDTGHDVALSFVDTLHPGSLPDFFALDVRVAKGFRLGPLAMQFIAEVLNATNHANAETRVYSYDRRASVYATGLPIVPNLGLRAEY